MRFSALWLVTTFVNIGCVAWFGQVQAERRTVVTPLPDEEILLPCDYRMILPEAKDPRWYEQLNVPLSSDGVVPGWRYINSGTSHEFLRRTG